MADQQLQTEDWVLFLSTVLGSAGMLATGNPMDYLYGITVGASSKALLSLGPNWKSWEDWILFVSAFLGSIGTSLTSNTNYMVYGLVIGAVGKALPSLAKNTRSIEDWLLFTIPLVTGIGSALSSQPKYAMVGLFFGMIGKSLASMPSVSGNGSGVSLPTPTTPSSTPPAPSTAQSGYAGNRNYILWNNCIPLINPAVTFTAGSDLMANGNWDLQVNAYAPAGTDAYMQFIMAVTSTGEVQWSVENWPLSGSNLFNTCDQSLCTLPSSFLSRGYSLGVKMNTDPNTNNVTSVEFSVTGADGTALARKTVGLDSTLPLCSGAWNDSYLSQVIGFEPNIVGYNSGVAVSFSSGSTGTLTCSAGSVSPSGSLPSCAEAKSGTVENSNMQYSVAVQTSPTVVTIQTLVP